MSPTASSTRSSHPPLRNYHLEDKRMLLRLSLSTASLSLPPATSDTSHLHRNQANRHALPRLLPSNIFSLPPLLFTTPDSPRKTSCFIPFPIHSGRELIGVISTVICRPFSAGSNIVKEEAAVILRYKMPELVKHWDWDPDLGVNGRRVLRVESRVDEVLMPRVVVREWETEKWDVKRVEFEEGGGVVGRGYRDEMERREGIPGIAWPGLRLERDGKKGERRWTWRAGIRWVGGK